MKTKIYVFEENNITFNVEDSNKVMVNATEMAKAFNAEVARFMENKGTKDFIESCLKTRNSAFLNIKSEEDLVTSKQKTGTFMHRILALKFAAWLSPDFEVWVYSTIDNLLFGKYIEREQSLERTVSLQFEQNALASKINKTGEDFQQYLNIENELRKEKSVRKSLTRDSVMQMATLFEAEEI